MRASDLKGYGPVGSNGPKYSAAPPPAEQASGELLADLELVWHSVSDSRETNAAYERLKAALSQRPEQASGGHVAPSVEAAKAMGAKGASPNESERLAFEAWMQGHCWALCATWRGTEYRSDAEQGGDLDPRAIATRRLWAAWRDRAALSQRPVAWTDDQCLAFAATAFRHAPKNLPTNVTLNDIRMGAQRAGIADALAPQQPEKGEG